MSVKVSDGSGGDFFKPVDGMYRLEFVGKEETTQKKYQSEEIEDAWRWNFHLTGLNGSIVLTDTGELAVYSDRTKQSLHVRSNGHKRLRALLGRDLIVGEDSEALFQQAIGTQCYGTFEGGWLKTVGKIPPGM